MKNIRIRLSSFGNVITLLLLLMSGSSFSQEYYAPDEGSYLVLRKKGDIHLSGIYGDYNSLNIQMGYSPINYLGLTGSYFKLKKGNTSIPLIWNGAVGGYFFFSRPSKFDYEKKKKWKRKSKRNANFFHERGLLADIYIGYGRGLVNGYYGTEGSAHFKFQKIYYQFGIHWSGKMFGFSYVLRSNFLNYYKGSIYGEIALRTPPHLNRIIDNKNKFNVIESSLRAYLGVKHIRYIMSFSQIVEGISGTEEIFSMGAIIEIDEFFREKTKPKEDEKVEF